jgi:hypothetical protein
MARPALVASLLLLFCVVLVCSADAVAPIVSLPGLSWKPSFAQYAGYVEVTNSSATDQRYLFYWYAWE